jgi:RimJ/RimL family protein N-acetyltransferase
MIQLVPFGPADFNQLIGWIDSEELLQNWAGSLFSYPLTTESLNWYITDTNVINESEAFIYKAVDEQGTAVGHISLGGISWKNRSARLTRVLVGNTAVRGKGIGQAMVKAAVVIGFEQLGFHRISLGVYTTNEAAIRCYTNCGFSIEGVHRDVLLQDGIWWSMVEMGILEQDWRL